ncbi:ribosomal protein P2, variant [Capsaspora owczarzaki ATCC 30864]|uniref:Ribosomal protein P2 n=1 Tax=Capsaspora owczarzaki (strain ATCC 30864) TaxID=595528 RepID=E9CCZ9_CAPO3|nr:ribosomal protein P2 [Capsaspora owczarzaki ATCC 30864]XP_011270585.1 ribosomal protein P2, variant [Capsaspora owczarzaki ATCC 30864]KJE95540.1 ribosomal protein P2 [Capsaspora owczarzaki ATCC 30864]|eukprot:XP_004345579.1 ribosomal protein P2 [Capsaspora owczarzaki ATCC 30864]
MRYIAAYLLATLGGNKTPSAADVKAILSSVGIEADETKLNKVIAELSGKSLEQLIAAGSAKLASVPAGGAAAAPAASSAAPAKEAKKEEPKKEEKKKEESEEGDMGFGLFD